MMISFLFFISVLVGIVILILFLVTKDKNSSSIENTKIIFVYIALFVFLLMSVIFAITIFNSFADMIAPPDYIGKNVALNELIKAVGGLVVSIAVFIFMEKMRKSTEAKLQYYKQLQANQYQQVNLNPGFNPNFNLNVNPNFNPNYQQQRPVHQYVNPNMRPATPVQPNQPNPQVAVPAQETKNNAEIKTQETAENLVSQAEEKLDRDK